MFLVDLIMINDEKALTDKITALYNVSYKHGGEGLEKEVFDRIYSQLSEAEWLVRENYVDTCEHYGIPASHDSIDECDDYIIGKLKGDNKRLIFGKYADVVTKEITLPLLNKVRKRLREPLKHLRKEKQEIGLYDAFANIPELGNEANKYQQSVQKSSETFCQSNEVIDLRENIKEYKVTKFSDLFYDSSDEIHCIDALRNIRPDKPLIGTVSDVWLERKGGKGILSAWICRMEDCRIIRTIRPQKELISILNDRFPGLNLGGAGRTLSGADPTIVAEFSSITLRKLR